MVVHRVGRGRVIRLLATLALFALGASACRAGSIFDDDWVPPQRPAVRTEAPPSARPVTSPAEPQHPATGTQPPAPAGTPGAVPPVSPAAVAAARPVPAAQEQARSRTLLRQVFAEELKDRTAPARRKLARRFIDEAAKADDNPSDQFVLLGGAISAAQEGADLPLCDEAADLLAARYAVDALSTKAEAALKMPLKAPTPAETTENVRAALELVSGLIAAEEFPLATRLCAALQPAAANDAALKTAVQQRTREVDAARLAHDRVAPHLARLKTAPDDPAANAAVGSYICLNRGRWEEGLPLLAKGNDPALKAAAAADLAAAGGDSGAAQAKAGDAWWDAASRVPAPSREAVRARAAFWYRKAAPGLTALERLRVEKHLAEVTPPAALPEAGHTPVRIVKATYGCPDQQVDVTAKVQAVLDRDPFAGVYADNALLGKDPCPFQGKTLRVRYTNGSDATPADVELKEHQLAVLPQLPEDGVPNVDAGQGFRIVAARYGCRLDWLDVTKLIRSRAATASMPFSFDNVDVAHDPGPGLPKYLIVWFDSHGRRYIRTYKENEGIHAVVLLK